MNSYYKVLLLRPVTNNILLNRAGALVAFFAISFMAVGQKPSANFTANPIAGCSPLFVTFQDQSLNNPTSRRWDLGNGSTPTVPNPSTIYITPGKYTVKLTVTNASGTDSLERFEYITVHPVPKTGFTTNDTIGCFPHTVKFTDTTSQVTGYINTNWEWNFGDGATSVLQNPTHTYSASGNYTVTLKVTNDKGCSKVISKTSYIKVSSGVVANFTKSAPNICSPPVAVSFTNNSTGPGTLTYAWNFGDGGTSNVQNPSHTFNSAGSYNVTLNVTSSLGCSASIVKNNEVVIGANTTSFTAPASAFTNTPVSFTNTSNPAPVSQSWNFGDGTISTEQNPTKTYTTAGTYTVTLTNVYSSCTFTATGTIIINPVTSASFIAFDTASCKPPLTVLFQSTTSDAVSWLWNFGDGTTSNQPSPVHTYTNYGEYTVKLVTTSGTGFVDSIIKTNFIKIKRATLDIDGIPPQGACLPFVFNPVPNISSVDPIVAYNWDFGDGGTSSLKFPTHTYTVQGNYTLQLITTTSKGCNDTLILPNIIRVGTTPVVNFTVSSTTPCVFTSVQFTNLSSPSGDEWVWDFGDNSNSTDQNPLHQYTVPGTYAVTLTVKNNGCENKLIKLNYITVLPPLSKITATPNCSNRTEFTFTDNSTGPLTWLWDFGDGTTSTLQNPPIHNFPGLGDQTVSLTVTNGGCTHSSSITVRTVNENPDFTSTANPVCRGNKTTFSAINIYPVNINSYFWDFGNGSQITTDKVTVDYVYTTSGTYTVTLITTDFNGCLDTAIKSNFITVFGPVANFSATNTEGCQGLTTTFNDLSVSDGINPLVSWKWDFGDSTNQTFTALPFTHTYNKVGTFSVKLITTDSYGCSDSITINDIINSTNPSVSFFAKDSVSCPGANIEWDVTASGSGLTYLWNFSDGSSSTDALPIKSFAATGSYSVKLFITDSFGCTDSTEKINHIRIDLPVAGFTVSDSTSSCAPFEVRFTNTSTFYISQLWTFEPGVTSTLANPAQYFNTAGLYNVELIATSPGGCTDTAYHSIEIFDAANSKINYTPLTGCKPQNVTFTAETNGASSYLWDFGDGETVTTTAPAVTHQYTTFGSFIPKAIIQDQTGCLIPVSGNETITIVGAVAKFGLDKNFLCDAGQINFLDSTTFNDPIISYNWDFGDGSTSTSQTPSHTYTGAGYYDVKLTVTTQLGCVDSVRLNNALKIVNSPDIRINSDTAACLYAPLRFYGNFNVFDTSSVSWFWDFKNGTTSALQNPVVQTYVMSGNFSPVVIATNSSGCKDTASTSIRIHPLPTASMPAEITTVAGNTINIPATYSGNMTNYLWSPSTFLSCTTCPQPDVTPEYNMNYLVVYSDSNNCRNSNTILIKALCNNSNVFVPNTFSPNEDGNNDMFYPRGRGINRVKIFRIFNRWGEIVFERYDFPVNNAIYGWDGTKKGVKANADVYIYQLEVYCQNGDVLSSTGNVTLIR
ncbi:MAG TPA: PKD domain-containing protein [Chitinophagaceae bacterium]|nr:PKD domain-containing protein [Chitinophagaceae bacterium]